MDRVRAAVDATHLPPAGPGDWSELRVDTHRLSRFICDDVIDDLRRVSPYLLIGRATHGDREMPSSFPLRRRHPT